MAAITLKVNGMTCGHCVASVTRVLERVPGVESAEVSLQTQRAIVTGRADSRVLIDAVRNEGYEASLDG